MDEDKNQSIICVICHKCKSIKEFYNRYETRKHSSCYSCRLIGYNNAINGVSSKRCDELFILYDI